MCDEAITSNFLTALTLSLGSELLHLWGSLLLALNFGPWGPGKAPVGVSAHVLPSQLAFPSKSPRYPLPFFSPLMVRLLPLPLAARSGFFWLVACTAQGLSSEELG